MMKRLTPPGLLRCAMASASVVADAPIMTAADLARFDNPAPDARIAYGKVALQFGDRRLPSGSGPHPVMVFVHGGCGCPRTTSPTAAS